MSTTKTIGCRFCVDTSQLSHNLRKAYLEMRWMQISERVAEFEREMLRMRTTAHEGDMLRLKMAAEKAGLP